jgi:hypothetical protein
MVLMVLRRLFPFRALMCVISVQIPLLGHAADGKKKRRAK